MSESELDALVADLWKNYKSGRDGMAADAITTLRAELKKERGGLTFTAPEVAALLAFFGGEPGEVTVQKMAADAVPDDPSDPVDEGRPSPAGLWAYMIGHPEEGLVWLGPADPDAPPRAARSAS